MSEPLKWRDVFNLETLIKRFTVERHQAPDDPLWQEACDSNIAWAQSMIDRIASTLPPWTTSR